VTVVSYTIGLKCRKARCGQNWTKPMSASNRGRVVCGVLAADSGDALAPTATPRYKAEHRQHQRSHRYPISAPFTPSSCTPSGGVRVETLTTMGY
jgi:hypothetical protein